MNDKLEELFNQLVHASEVSNKAVQIVQDALEEIGKKNQEFEQVSKDYDVLKEWHDMIVPKIQEKDKTITDQANRIGKLEEMVNQLTVQLSTIEGTEQYKTAMRAKEQAAISKLEADLAAAKQRLDKIK